MFNIKEYVDKFKIYELRDEKADSWIKICPERGGIITSFGVNGSEVLYLNKETFYDISKNIRGGNPILFPLCGQLPDCKYTLNDKEYIMKNHGIARTASWKVVSKNNDENASIKLSFKSNKETLKSYPFEFELQFEYVLKGNKLTINQQYINNSNRIMPMSAGFHPYFYVKDKKGVRFNIDTDEYFNNLDLETKQCSEDSICLNDLKEFNLICYNRKDNMSFYLKDLNRKIIFDYSNEFRYIVIWSTPGNDFVCVEPWTSKVGVLQSKEGLLEINPRDKLELSYSITVE